MLQNRNSSEKHAYSRQVAVKLLTSAERNAVFVNREMEKVLAREPLPRRDRALVTMLVNGVMRMRLRLDYEIAQYYQRDFQHAPSLLKNILRLAFYQSEFLDRVPAHAIVFESVSLARRFFGEERSRFVNAILRERQRRPVSWPPLDLLAHDLDALAAYVSHPRWLLERWLLRMPVAEVMKLAEANNQPPSLTLRVVRPEIHQKDFEQHARTWKVGVEPVPHVSGFYRLRGAVDVSSLAAIRNGLCVVQDVSAGLAGLLMAAQPGERIYDMCAAPGGKALHMAEGGATVTAVDINAERLQLVDETSARLGLPVKSVAADATTFAEEPADGVLVDAPCSGLGVLSKRADLRWLRTPEDFVELQALQLRLLDNAARLVKSGGRLVYSTCTFEPEENELVIRRFLETHPGFQIEPAEKFVDPAFCDDRGFITTLPHFHGMDGSFAARLRRD